MHQGTMRVMSYREGYEICVRIRLVTVSSSSLLLFDKHISNKVNKAYMMLGIIKKKFRSFISKVFYDII